MRVLLVICIFIDLHWTHATPFKGVLKKEGVFKKVADYALSNHVISTTDVTSVHDCTLACLGHSRCVSYNFQITDSPTKKCELSDQTKVSKPSDYVSKPGYSYYDAEEFVLPICSASPCLNNGKCVDECLGTYTCKCPGNYIGQNCETWIGFNGTTPGFAGKSCKTIKFISYLGAGDGNYWIDPVNTGSAIQVICDMTTDGGGWIVVKNLTLVDSTPSSNVYNRDVYSRVAGLDKYAFLSQAAYVSLKADMGFTQARFYCKKKNVGRVFHIMTKANELGYAAVSYLFIKTAAYPTACNSFIRMPDDTSVLARNCQKWGYHNAPTLGNSWGTSANNGRHRMYAQIAWMDGYTFIMKQAFRCDDFSNSNHAAGDTYKVFLR